MNIDKALDHFKWKFKNSWKPTETDIKAYNTIIEFKEMQESINLSENEALAKLWIHQLMLLNDTEMYSSERAIQVIDEILSKSVYEWCIKLRSQANIMRFKTLLETSEYKIALKERKPLKMHEIGYKQINDNPEKFKEALNREIKEDDIIKFVERQITRILK